MSAVRALGGTLGVVVVGVLLLLGVLLSPVLLPIAALGLLGLGVWKLWRLKHKVERTAEHGHKRVAKVGKKARKKTEKALRR